MSFSNKKIGTWYRWLFHRRRIIRNLEIVQDFIVISLGVWLLGAMLVLLTEVFRSLLAPPLQFEAVTSDILFLLILVELFRLLIVYLQEHRISVEVAVEVAIVSALREIIVEGVLEIHWEQILAVCAFLLVMGALLLVCYQTPHVKELPSFSKESQRSSSSSSN